MKIYIDIYLLMWRANLPTIRVEVVPDVEELGGAEGAHLQAGRLLAAVGHDAFDCPLSASLRGHAHLLLLNRG